MTKMRLRQLNNVQETWKAVTEVWLKAAKQVYGRTKGPPRHNVTWW